MGYLLRRKVTRLPLDENLEAHIHLLRQWKPSMIVGPPSYFRSLIAEAEARGLSLRAKIAVICGEMLDGATRKRVADRLGAEVYETFGVSEVGGIAWECPSRSGYHLNSDSCIIEFLTEDGEGVAPGEPGQLCVTNLWRKPTPMIRYLTGDTATPAGDECSCGRGLPLVRHIEGRLLDFIQTRAGESISPYRVMFMMEGVPGIGQYKVVQNKDYSIELMIHTIEAPFDEVEPTLKQECETLFGDTPFTITRMEKFRNLTGGKFRPVESKVNR
jgi:phenylacetate-CoA ligase